MEQQGKKRSDTCDQSEPAGQPLAVFRSLFDGDKAFDRLRNVAIGQLCLSHVVNSSEERIFSFGKCRRQAGEFDQVGCLQHLFQFEQGFSVVDLLQLLNDLAGGHFHCVETKPLV